MAKRLARKTHKNINSYKRTTLRKSKHLRNKTARRRVYTSKRLRRGGYEITSKREARKYLKDYAKEAPYLEEDSDVEIYDPELDIEDESTRVYALGNKPPPRPSRFTGVVDVSDLTGIQKQKRGWNPFARFTRKNKMQRVPAPMPVSKQLPYVRSEVSLQATQGSDGTESLTESEDYDDGSLGDLYEEVRADQPPIGQPIEEEKPSFFSRLFGTSSKKVQAPVLAQGQVETQKKPWYKFWGGISNKARTRKIRRIRKSKKVRRQRGKRRTMK